MPNASYVAVSPVSFAVSLCRILSAFAESMRSYTNKFRNHSPESSVSDVRLFLRLPLPFVIPVISLHFRCVGYNKLHSSRYERVPGITGIDEYIRYGGTMSLGDVDYNSDSVFATPKTEGRF